MPMCSRNCPLQSVSMERWKQKSYYSGYKMELGYRILEIGCGFFFRRNTDSTVELESGGSWEEEV